MLWGWLVLSQPHLQTDKSTRETMGFLFGGNAPRWDITKMPSQVGKIAIVTGSNSGIGYYTARALAERGAHVILACRNEKRGREAESEMTKYLAAKQITSAGSVEFKQVDLSVLQSVHEFADGIKARFGKLDLLINNAGIAAPTEVLTSDGLETQFQVNHLSHFLLTALLFPLLKKSPAARVVTVSSLAHRTAAVDFPTLAKGTEYSLPRYGRSKLANCLFTLELASRLEAAKIANVVAVVAHPGMTYSAMVNKIIESMAPGFLCPVLEYIATWVPFQETEMGALPTLYAATDMDVTNGDYIGPADYGHRRGYPMKQTPGANTQSREDRLQLWQLSETLTQIHFDVK
jgi:NAD(P)-dependent dehydrogenase (short-subunit alcohol dehydrogenase family)